MHDQTGSLVINVMPVFNSKNSLSLTVFNETLIELLALME